MSEYAQYPSSASCKDYTVKIAAGEIIKSEWFRWQTFTKHVFLLSSFSELTSKLQSLLQGRLIELAIAQLHETSPAVFEQAVPLLQKYSLPAQLDHNIIFYRDLFEMLGQVGWPLTFRETLAMEQKDILGLIIKQNKGNLLLGRLLPFYSERGQDEAFRRMTCEFISSNGQEH
jgi:hypothetical protein